MTDSLFPDLQPYGAPPGFPTPQLSAGVRRTRRQQALLAQGRHPLQGSPLDPDPAHTCGTCAWKFLMNGGNRDYHKCAKSAVTHGPATDIRLRWPGCSQWSDTR